MCFQTLHTLVSSMLLGKHALHRSHMYLIVQIQIQIQMGANFSHEGAVILLVN